MLSASAIPVFGVAWAAFWTGFLRVGAQSALLLAPLAAALLLVRWYTWLGLTTGLGSEPAGDFAAFPRRFGSVLRTSDKRLLFLIRMPPRDHRNGIRTRLMSVRRLDAHQPASFAFTPENAAWAEATIANYPPGKQASAVIPLLWRAQEQHGGWLPEPAMRLVADMLGMAYIRVYEIATFYTMFQLSPVGKKAHVWVCGTTPCMLRGAEALVEVCKRRIHEEPHHLSKDGDFSWEEVECLGRVRQRAHGADRQGHLRGPDARAVREGARRLRQRRGRPSPARRSAGRRAARRAGRRR